MSKRLSKSIANFDYFDKASIFYLQQAVEYLLFVFIAKLEILYNSKCLSFSFAFSLATGIIAKLLETTRIK